MENNKPTLTSCFANLVACVVEQNRLTMEYNKKVGEFAALVDAFPVKKERPCAK